MNQITIPQNELQRRDQLVGLVNKHFEISAEHYRGVLQKLPRLYDVWRGIYTGRFHPHKNNVHVPLIYAAVWADAARKAATSLSEWPIVRMLGSAPAADPVARTLVALLSAQMRDADGFMKEINTHVCAGLYGTAISQAMWDRRTEKVCFDDYQALPLSGERIRQIKTAEVVTFDGPNWDNVDRLDFAPYPGIARIPKMRGVGRRYFLDLDDLRFMSRAKLGKKPIFNPSEVARLEREGVGAQMATDEAFERRYMARIGMSDEAARNMDPSSRPVEVREYWGTVPSEWAINGCTNVVMTVANRTYLLRAEPNPFWHRMKPFFQHSPTPDPHYFDSCGKAEIAEKLQLTANRYVNQRLDAADLVIDPAWFYDRNSGLNTRNLFMKPGRFIGVDGPPAEKVHPMMPDLRGMQVGANMTAEMMTYIERGTGMQDDTVMGIDNGGSDRQTAREFVSRRESAGTRLALESMIYEIGYLEPLVNCMHRLNRQHLEGPVEFMILGENARVDPINGMPILDTRESLQGYELAVTYSARAMGATTSLSKGVRQQNLITLLQAVGTNPYVVGSINFVNFFRQLFREFDMKNVNELINQQADLKGMVAQAQGQSASDVPDTANGSGDIAMQIAQLAGSAN